MKIMQKMIMGVLFTVHFCGGVASASGVRFGFNNPSFGGSPFNASYFISMADKQNQNQKVVNKEDPTSATGFKKQLDSQLASTTAAKIAKLVTDSENPPDQENTYIVGDLTITTSVFNPDTGVFTITITGPNGVILTSSYGFGG